jgi:Cu(I)/Ag(I) efflux system membrane fusion protein
MKTMNVLKSPQRLLVAVVATAAMAFGLGYWYAGSKIETGSGPGSGFPNSDTGSAQVGINLSEDLVYVCPMSCIPPMERPGACPVCGMELVGVSPLEHGHQGNISRIRLDDAAVRSAGIRTARVERRFVTAEVRLFGRIEYDPVEQYKVTAFAPGVIDRIYVKRAGQTVRAGDPLFDIHSAELFYLEQELFEVLQLFPDPVDYRPAQGQRYRRLMRPAARRSLTSRDDNGEEDEEKKAALDRLEQIKRKMRLLGLQEKDIETIMARGRPTGISTVTTPTTGVVFGQYAFKGSYVNTGDLIFNIANPKYMWAKFDAYESDFPWIRIGQEAEFETDAYPGQPLKGKVLYLDTEFNPKTRTFTVGVLHQESKVRLRPNMLARCVIHARLTADGLSVPESASEEKPPLVIPHTAPLITGKRAVVYVAIPGEPGRFEGRRVVLGPKAEGYYVVREGLVEGDSVVVNGNFKIDSAVQILARPSMMEPQDEGAEEGHSGAGMEKHVIEPETPAETMDLESSEPGQQPSGNDMSHGGHPQMR